VLSGRKTEKRFYQETIYLEVRLLAVKHLYGGSAMANTSATGEGVPQLTPISFDRRFVVGALLIGGGYAAIVSLIGWFLGKEVAGVAGVALTALATAIFKQYETLQFKAQAESASTVIQLPRLNTWFLATLVAAFLGVQVLLDFVPGIVFAFLGYFEKLTSMQDLYHFFREHLLLIAAITALSHGLAGFLTAKTHMYTALSYPVIASVLSDVAQTVAQVAGLVAQHPESIRLLLGPSFYVFGLFWLGYALAALIGARIGLGKIA
jgi:hypothetical protein